MWWTNGKSNDAGLNVSSASAFRHSIIRLHEHVHVQLNVHAHAYVRAHAHVGMPDLPTVCLSGSGMKKTDDAETFPVPEKGGAIWN
jgi:hypothetical protein